MALIRSDILRRLPDETREYYVYYPDVLLYHHNAIQYAHYWRNLAQSKYLYTNGYDIQPTNWLVYAFQTLIGWLGFENHCQQDKIQFTLKKLSFYGYLCGYSQEPLAAMSYYPMQPGYLELVNHPRNNETTNILHKQLISDYVALIEPKNRHPYLPIINNAHIYGETWQHLQLWNEIPFLDPQNVNLINSTIEHLEPLNVTPLHYTFHKNGLYAQKTATYYLDKAKIEKKSMLYGWNWLSGSQKKAQSYLERARHFDPEASSKELPSFIDYYLEKKDYEQAFNLINQLTELPLALTYLLKHFTEKQRLEFVQKDSPLALQLANYYLKNNNTAAIELAANFDSKLEEHNPGHAFILHVSKNQHEEAYALFKKHNSQTFPMEQRKILASYFNKVGESLYEEGLLHRSNKDWDKGKKSYFDSLLAKKKAYTLTDSQKYKEEWYTHQRLYAQLLIQSDIENSEGKLETIVKAIKLLDDCHPETKEEKGYHLMALTRGLMRQVDYLTKKIVVPLIYSQDYDTQKQHHAHHAEDFKLIQTILKRVIDLLKDTQKPELKSQLAKAHFILGDMNMFFDLEGDDLQHFRLAMENAPENPFYLLRVSEKFESEKPKLLDKAILLLKKLGYTITDYYHWDNQRWDQEGYKFNTIKNIHELTDQAPAKSSWGLRFN